MYNSKNVHTKNSLLKNKSFELSDKILKREIINSPKKRPFVNNHKLVSNSTINRNILSFSFEE